MSQRRKHFIVSAHPVNGNQNNVIGFPPKLWVLNHLYKIYHSRPLFSFGNAQEIPIPIKNPSDAFLRVETSFTELFGGSQQGDFSSNNISTLNYFITAESG